VLFKQDRPSLKAPPKLEEFEVSYRIAPIDPDQAQGHAKELLTAVHVTLGMTPNLMRTMAHSPAALEGYLTLNRALAKGSLSAAVREQLALAVAQQNRCEYCLAAHTALGKHAGLNADQILAARSGQSADAKTKSQLKLANQIVENRGNLTDDQLFAAREAGVGDGEIVEIVAHVALNVLTNYFNLVARTEVDFPKVLLSL
jgi:uncharacterized peroxidase-related enzyme